MFEIHPDESRILRLLDGEIPESERVEVERHLSDCSECAEAMQQIESASALFKRRHQELTRAAVPPMPWCDIREKLRQADTQVMSKTLLLPERPPEAVRIWWWGAAAAAVVGALLVAGLPFGTKLNAAEVLSKAVSAEQAQPVARRHIRIKSGRFEYVRPAVLRTPEDALKRRQPDPLRARFVSARFNWDNPLSAQSFAEWRGSLRSPEDRVIILNRSDLGPGRHYRVRTKSADGVLAEVSLTLRADTMHPVQESFQFRSGESVEITEASDVPVQVPPPPHLASGEQKQDSPETTDTISPEEELRVLAALHSIGADLGEPIEVVVQQNRIHVNGLNPGPRRQAQIRSALAGLPDVLIDFEAPVSNSHGTVRQESTRVDTSTPLQARLEEIVGGRAGAERFVNEVLDTSDRILTRAYALQNLAARFPVERESEMGSNARQILRKLVRDHKTEIDALARRLPEQLSPVLNGSPRPAPSISCDTWQSCSGALMGASKQLDEALSTGFASADPEKSPSDLVSQIQSALAAWLAAVSAFKIEG
ncbi:MAG TPA: zf-HC2 domain-containing protein [Bryobacteraceae bacterium]|nr:zf-HC2 domain-containing protein [Bryobacteraceae bacterium]